MVLHSDSELGALLTLLVLFAGFLGLCASVVLLVSRQFRSSLNVLLITVGGLGVYVLGVIAIAIVTPQTIVNVGDSYCMDIWCIGIEKVNMTPRGDEMLYRVDVRIFSDANSVTISAKGASVYVVDERGRRFELLNDPSVIPFDAPLAPKQSIHTTLTFAAPADARQLFLPCGSHHIGEEPSVPFWVKLYFGSDAGYLHKQTMLRVL
jgi:hypothetical protein